MPATLKTIHSILKRFLKLSIISALISSAHANEISCVTESYHPYTYNKDNVVTGSATKFVVKILNTAGLTCKLELLPWARTYHRALNVPNTVIFMLARTELRENKFLWIGPIVKPIPISFFTINNPNLNLELNTSSRIGVVNGTAYHDYLKSKNFMHIKQVPDYSTLIPLLLQRRVDFIFLQNKTFNKLNKEASKNLANSNFFKLIETPLEVTEYLAMNINSSKVLYEKLKNTYDQLITEGDLKLIE